jgi:hypothetical protein
MDTYATREAYRDRKKKLKRLYEEEFGKGAKTKEKEKKSVVDESDEGKKKWNKEEREAIRKVYKDMRARQKKKNYSETQDKFVFTDSESK